MTPDEELVLFDESKVPMSTQSSAALQLRGLLDELADALDAPDFQLVLKACLDKMFGQLSMSLDSAFISPSSSADSSDPSAATTSTITELPDRCVRLVKLLPRVAREASNIVNANPNEYIEVCTSLATAWRHSLTRWRSLYALFKSSRLSPQSSWLLKIHSPG